MNTTVTSIDGQAIESDSKIKFTSKTNPKREGSKAHARFQNYMGSRTVQEYLDNGGTKGDLKYDSEKGFIEIQVSTNS